MKLKSHPKGRLKRSQFEKMVGQCLVVLANHAFTPRPLSKPKDTRFTKIFEKVCRVEPEKKRRTVVKTNLSNSEMNNITLKCALILVRYGATGIRYFEELNMLRSCLGEVLKEMGYEEDERWYYHTAWNDYPLWAKIARKCGLSREDVAMATA